MTLGDPLVYVRAVHFAATLLVAGIAFFIVLVAEPAFRQAGAGADFATNLRRRLNWIAWIGLALTIISGAAWFDLTAAAMSGQPVTAVFSHGVWWTVLSDTDFGEAWLIRFALACMLAALFDPSLARQPIKSGRRRGALVVAAAALTGLLAWAGHAIGGQGAEGIVHPAADVLHLIAAAAWLGGLIPLALLLAAAENENGSLAVARAATLRFSTLGLFSVATLLITGGINTWYLAGSIPALTGTDYGRLLLAKIALFLVMVGIAAVNRLRLTPRVTQSTDRSVARNDVRQLRRNALLEAAAGAVVIVIVGVIGTLPPAAHAGHHHEASGAVPADAAFQHIHSEQGMADVIIEPGRVGTARATIRLWDADFAPLAAKAVTLRLTSPAAGSQPATRFATQGSDGAWQVDGIDLAQAGDWSVVVDVLLGPDKHLVLDAPIVIDPKQ